MNSIDVILILFASLALTFFGLLIWGLISEAKLAQPNKPDEDSSGFRVHEPMTTSFDGSESAEGDMDTSKQELDIQIKDHY